jgi:hypothetical protein
VEAMVILEEEDGEKKLLVVGNEHENRGQSEWHNRVWENTSSPENGSSPFFFPQFFSILTFHP